MTEKKINVITEEGNLVEKDICVHSDDRPYDVYDVLKSQSVSSLKKMDVLLQCLMLSNALSKNNKVCAQASSKNFVVDFKEGRCEVFFYSKAELIKEAAQKNEVIRFSAASFKGASTSYLTPIMQSSLAGKNDICCSTLTNKYAFAQIVLKGLKKFDLNLFPILDNSFDSCSVGELLINDDVVNEAENVIFNQLKNVAMDIVTAVQFKNGMELAFKDAVVNAFEAEINLAGQKIQFLIQKECVRRQTSSRVVEEPSLADVSFSDSEGTNMSATQQEQWAFSPERASDVGTPKRKIPISSLLSALSDNDSEISGISCSSNHSDYYINFEQALSVSDITSDGSLNNRSTLSSKDNEFDSKNYDSYDSDKSWDNKKFSQKSLPEKVPVSLNDVKNALKSVIMCYTTLIQERQKNCVSYLFQRHGRAGYARAKKLLEEVEKDNISESDLKAAIKTCFEDYEKTSYHKDCGTSKNSLTRHILANSTLVDFLELNKNILLKKNIEDKTIPNFINANFANDWKGEESDNHSFSFFGKAPNRTHMKVAAGIVKEHLAKGMCAVFMFFMNTMDILDIVFDVGSFV